MVLTLLLSIATVALVGPLAGMSLDQLIKQLPARRNIGNSAYSAYMRAADLQNGVFLYALFGVGAALAAIAAAISGHVSNIDDGVRLPLDISALFAILHSATTAVAAPTAFSQQKLALTDEAGLARVLTRFERWHRMRTVLQVINFAVAIWAAVITARVSI